MIGSWWDLGDWSGSSGSELSLYNIVCPFCMERGNFSFAHRAEKRKPNSSKTLHFDTLQCGNCAAYVLVFWSGSGYGQGLHDYRQLPWPIRIDEAPNHWPEAVGRYWIQAHRSLTQDNWDAAALMARSALQVALREHGAKKGPLKSEIDDLAGTGVLPSLMKDWAHELRELGNDSAHPQPGQPPTAPEDAKDIVRFLDFLLEYLYNLPHQIAQYRARTR